VDICYPANIELQKDKTYLVRFVDLADTFSEGHTREEALFNASVAAKPFLSFAIR